MPRHEELAQLLVLHDVGGLRGGPRAVEGVCHHGGDVLDHLLREVLVVVVVLRAPGVVPRELLDHLLGVLQQRRLDVEALLRHLLVHDVVQPVLWQRKAVCVVQVRFPVPIPEPREPVVDPQRVQPARPPERVAVVRARDEMRLLEPAREVAVGERGGYLLEPGLEVEDRLALLLVKQGCVGEERRAARHAAPEVVV